MQRQLQEIRQKVCLSAMKKVNMMQVTNRKCQLKKKKIRNLNILEVFFFFFFSTEGEKYDTEIKSSIGLAKESFLN